MTAAKKRFSYAHATVLSLAKYTKTLEVRATGHWLDQSLRVSFIFVPRSSASSECKVVYG